MAVWIRVGRGHRIEAAKGFGKSGGVAMRNIIGLANRRLQPLGHLSGGRDLYKTQHPRSNAKRDSCDSRDSGAQPRVHKGGHSGTFQERIVAPHQVSGRTLAGDRKRLRASTAATAAEVTKEVAKIGVAR